ncbi:MAG TPA: nucleotide disphospho-sugar-binding domain-containing protein [Actinocrinis sp.]
MSDGFLFVSPPLAGHVNPMASVAGELAARGHRVAWAGSEAYLRPRLGPHAVIHPIPMRVHRGGAERGLAATKSRWQGYIAPHAAATRSGIDGAVRAFRPGVLVVDQHAVAGAIAAHRHALPWASMATTTMELTRPYRGLPLVEAWIRAQMAAIWTAAGMPGEPPHDLRFSPHLVISFLDAGLAGARVPGTGVAGLAPGEPLWPDNTVLVGPALPHRLPAADFPWEWLDPGRRHVLVTVGTLALGFADDFYRRMTEALRPLGDRLQAIVVAPETMVPDPSEHVMARPTVPVLELMPRLDAVVCHAGVNTVCEALAHAVPLVLAPVRSDQPITAAQVEAAGAGIRVRFDGTPPERLRTALLTVLDDPSYRAAAGRVRESFRAAGGAPAAADHLEALARRHAVSRRRERSAEGAA